MDPNAILECVPNFSEGRRPEVIESIAAAVRQTEGVQLLDIDPGKATNRTVFTFAGSGHRSGIPGNKNGIPAHRYADPYWRASTYGRHRCVSTDPRQWDNDGRSSILCTQIGKTRRR